MKAFPNRTPMRWDIRSGDLNFEWGSPWPKLRRQREEPWRYGPAQVQTESGLVRLLGRKSPAVEPRRLLPQLAKSRFSSTGFTLMEVSLVIALILGLTTFIGFSVSAISDWQRGKNAGLGLQAVYATQRAYMADHPTADIATVTTAQLQVYLPSGWSAMPTFKGLNDESLTLDHAVMPPRLELGNAVYDPSGKSSDGLWDAGQ